MNRQQAEHLYRGGWSYIVANNKKLVMAGALLVAAGILCISFLLSGGQSGAHTRNAAHSSTTSTLLLPGKPQTIHTQQTQPTPIATLDPQMAQIASQADSLLTREVTQQGFSGTVLLAHNGQKLLDKGYSMADWGQQIPNTSHTRFYIGSTSKQFTGMAILILQKQGKLSVQDPICAHISPCPSTWQAVTLHEILTHTSGIPELDDSALSGSSPQAWIKSFDGVDLVFTPGSQFSYCSICYQILGYVVEQVSNQPYRDFLQQAIFDPLQMKDSGTGDAHYTSVRDHAVGYAGWQNIDGSTGMDVDPQWSFLYGSGLIYSSAEDMYLWDQALIHSTLVSQQITNEAFTPYITSQYAGSSYGYGWFIGHSPVPGHKLIWHDGKIPGFRTYNGFYPDDGNTIIIMSNLASVDEVILAGQLEQLLFARMK